MADISNAAVHEGTKNEAAPPKCLDINASHLSVYAPGPDIEELSSASLILPISDPTRYCLLKPMVSKSFSTYATDCLRYVNSFRRVSDHHLLFEK